MGTVESLHLGRRRATTADDTTAGVGSSTLSHGGPQRTDTSIRPATRGPVPRCFEGPLHGGRYHLGPVLGSGSSATCFVGWDSVANVKVALKASGFMIV
jgi:hypothetical protein